MSAADVRRLDAAVMAELEQLVQRSFPQKDRTVPAESAGGHVTGTACNGRVLAMSIDSKWASIARNSEIEGELVEVLDALYRTSAPTAGVHIDENSAIAEVMGLLFDPHRLIRRVGLGVASCPDAPRRPEHE